LRSKIPSGKKCDLVVLDILGPVDPADIFGNQYILKLCDHTTTFLYCFLLKSSSELETKLTNALNIIKNQVGAPKFFCCNNTKEYTKQLFAAFLNLLGTTQALTAAYTPEQNGEAERLNRTLGDMARCIMKQSGLQSFAQCLD
jgi:hypothetical protein